MRACFRVDASIDIGTGHVMRCLTLAHALKANGWDCRFICRDHPGNLNNHIRNNGFAVDSLPSAGDRISHLKGSVGRVLYRHWLGATQNQDARESLAILAELKIDLLVVDHYAIDEVWESQVGQRAGTVMVIDDLADRAHQCDLLLDQNPGRVSTDYHNLVPADCAIRTGPQFALLRPEFTRLRPHSLARRKDPLLEHILISMGGVDKDNHTSRVLEAIQASSLAPECRISVVMGPEAPWLEEVTTAASCSGWPTDVRIDVQDMAALMTDSDLAIGAVGITALERCCLGLPALAVISAENQIQGAKALQALGALVIIDAGEDFYADFTEKLALCSTAAKLAEMHRCCRKITGGTGAGDLARELTHEQR